MLRGSRALSGKIHRPFLAHVVPPLAARISRKRLVAKVGTFENKNVHKHLHLWPLWHHRRRLAVRAATSKGSTVSQYGRSTFGALATEAQYKEEEGEEEPIHLPWRGGSTFLRNVVTFNHYVVLKPKRLSSHKIKEIEIETLLTSVRIMGFPPALIERLNPALQTSQSEPGLPRMLDTTHWRQVWSLFPQAPLAGSITRYVWQLNIVSLLVFHLHAHSGPGV